MFTFFACVFFLPMASHAVDPYVTEWYGESMTIEFETLLAMNVMIGLLFLLPLVYLVMPAPKRLAAGYLAGVNLDGSATYQGAMGATRTVETRTYYLKGFLSEKGLTVAGYLLSCLLLVIIFVYLIS